MQLQIFRYNTIDGWSVKEFPKLDSDRTLILMFVAPEYSNNLTPIVELSEHYPKSKIIGCSTAGEIFGPSVYDHSISVAVVKLEKTNIKLVKILAGDPCDSFDVGCKVSSELNVDGLKGILVFSDGLGVNGSELAKGLSTSVSENVSITGGLAGDGKDFKKTFTICNGLVCDKTVVAVGFYGDYIKIGHATKGGWDNFGPKRFVTKSNGNILYELDGKPALDLYKKYLGEKAAELPASGLYFPLSISAVNDNHGDKSLVRTILSINETEKSLTFAGDIPQGCYAQLMRANFDRLISSAGETSTIAVKMISNDIKQDQQILSIAISCVGRKLALGSKVDEETQLVLEMLPSNSQQIGFYSYGELSPYTTGVCDLHNQTMTLTILSEM